MKKFLCCEKLPFRSFISLTMYYFLKLCLKGLKFVVIFLLVVTQRKNLLHLFILYVMFFTEKKICNYVIKT